GFCVKTGKQAKCGEYNLFWCDHKARKGNCSFCRHPYTDAGVYVTTDDCCVGHRGGMMCKTDSVQMPTVVDFLNAHLFPPSFSKTIMVSLHQDKPNMWKSGNKRLQ